MIIDKALIAACIKKDDLALRELYMILHEPLMRVCMKYYVNEEDALSVMHDGVLKIYKTLKKYKYEKSFLNWCRVLMINVIIDDIRRSKRRKYFERYDTDKTMLLEESTEANGLELEDEWEFVEDALKLIPQASRIVFSLYVFEEYKHKEIAKKLRISEGTSKWHVSTAKKILKENLTLKKDGKLAITIEL